MTIEEAEELIIGKEGRVCLRMFRRSDGTVLTRDCPKGLAAVKRRLVTLYGSVSAVASLAILWILNMGKPEPQQVEPVQQPGQVKAEPYQRDIPPVERGWTAGTPAFPQDRVMGQMLAISKHTSGRSGR